MALGSEIVDLVRANLLDYTAKIGRICQVTEMHMEAHIRRARVDIEVVDAGRIEGRRAPLEAVHPISLFEQKLRQV